MDRDLEAVGVLVEPQRLRVYEHLLAAGAPSSLADMGAALGLSRTLLAFHVAKLVEAGFVEPIEPAPAQGRRGRPSSRYQVTRHEASASIPARHYDLIAEILLEAAGEGPGSARQIARRRGAELARADGSERRGRTTRSRLRRVERLLAALGYAPRTEGDELVLANCPFDRLRSTNLELVCSLNHALGEGYLDGLGLADDLVASLRPCPDACCVVVSPA